MTTSDTFAPVRVALIGYGLAGAVFHAPLIAATPGLQLATIVTRNPERQRQAWQRYPEATLLTDPDEVWGDPSRYDLVVVATPNSSHVPLGLAALAAGLPVVIDKPLAASVADAERLLARSQQTGKMLTVFQNRRWDNDFLTVRKILAADLLGPITRYESRFERYRPQPNLNAWRESSDPQDAGGQLFDLGSHLIDQALQLFGTPQRVYAEMARRRPQAQVDDDTFVSLHFASGIHAHLWVSQVARIPGPRVRLCGLRGTYEKWGLDPQEDALRAGNDPTAAGWGHEPRDLWGHLSTAIGDLHIDGPIETEPGAYPRYYAMVRDALRSGAPPPVDPASVLTVLRVLEAAQESAREGRVVML